MVTGPKTSQDRSRLFVSMMIMNRFMMTRGVHSFMRYQSHHHYHRDCLMNYRPGSMFNSKLGFGGKDAISRRCVSSQTKDINSNNNNNNRMAGDYDYGKSRKTKREEKNLTEQQHQERQSHPFPGFSTNTIATAANNNHNHKYSLASMVPFFLDLSSKALLGVTGIAVTFLGFLYFNQENMLYIPQLDEDIPRNNSANPPGYRSPNEYNIPYEEVWIPTDDEGVEIHTWLLLKEDNDQASSSRPTIVFFHGNAGNIGIRLPNAEQMYNILNCNVFLVEYRGYGDSRDGIGRTTTTASRRKASKPTEERLKRDGEIVVKYIQNHPNTDASKIVLFGRSLGGAVAFHVASTLQQQQQQQQHEEKEKGNNDHKPPPLAGMIVENTFCSIDDMADILFPFLTKIKGPLLKMHWDSKSIATTLNNVPILYLSGQSDEIVPPSQMRTLHELSMKASTSSSNNNRIVFHGIPNGRHNDTWLKGGRDYWNAMMQFINQATTK